MVDAAPEAVVVALTTAPDPDAAAVIARSLLDEKLIACANILPGVTSMYRWEGEVRTDGEVLVVLKSVRGVEEALTRRLLEVHPYDVPELLVLDADRGSEAYLEWVRGEVRQS